MLKAGTPEKIDQEPIGTGPSYLLQYQKDAVIRYKAFPEFWGGRAKIDDLILRHINLYTTPLEIHLRDN